jgi:alpha-tubulin suppressor-like RCC1 family protein
MPLPNITTNFKFSDGIDVGEKLITKDYLISVYPQLIPSLFSSSLWGWGYGQPWSMSSNSNYSSPVNVSYGLNWKQISCTHWNVFDGHAAAIKSDGTLWTVGRNSYGELGLGDNSDRYNFTKVGSDTNWRYVQCGPRCTAAIKSDGTLWTTGRNVERQLGLGDSNNRNSFKQVSFGIQKIQFVSISAFSMSAIAENGTLWSWGTNSNGILGLNQDSSSYYTANPSLVTSDYKFKVMDINYNTAYAVATSGELFRWGNLSDHGGSSFTKIPSILNYGSWKTVACGYRHAAAIKKDGTLWTVGNNELGALGNGTSFDYGFGYGSSTLFQIRGIWKQVSCGNYMTAAISSDGSLWTWGNNGDNQLGQNINSGFTTTPAEIYGGGYNWKNIICAPFGMYGIKSYEY